MASSSLKRSWQSWLKSFILYQKAQGLAQRTIDDYNYHVQHFFKAYPDALKDYETLQESVLDYFAKSNSLAPATFNTRRKCLRCFFGWLKEKGVIPENPILEIRHRKEDKIPRSAPEEALEKLLSLPNKKTFAGLRDYALIVFTLDTGIRPKEAFGLIPENFNLEIGQVEIPAAIAKTRQSRILPLHPQTVFAVSELLMARPRHWSTNVPVFCTEDGRPLNRNQWARRMRQYSSALGVKIKPYSLRHSFALLFLRNGGNAFSLQSMLGHTNMDMTSKYVYLSKNDIETAHKDASPINRILSKTKRIRNIKPRD
ncbi:tyrosine-type recombinase/integrase [Thermoanaerobacterium sp. DL9XJH110]|uniref:tyrosine-type recombinase/integrase n=1 Tax=Thermoanaerobacterium sp. DL9XJH110 TaxID=3386643 RepID=UPI003BB80F9D